MQVILETLGGEHGGMLVAKTWPFRRRSCSTEISRTIAINGSGFRCADNTLSMPGEALVIGGRVVG